jgi:hypothetical protein
MTQLAIPAALNQLRDYTFTYFPWTDWSSFFRPTFNFGCNVEDAPTEKAVLDKVGSYGSQLNRILDALVVLVDEELVSGGPKDSDPKAADAKKEALYVLKRLAADADKASTLAAQKA